jgi:hypothetical protein
MESATAGMAIVPILFPKETSSRGPGRDVWVSRWLRSKLSGKLFPPARRFSLNRGVLFRGDPKRRSRK